MLRVLAFIKDRDTVVGLRLFDEKSKSFGDFKILEAAKMIKTYGCSNFSLTNGKLESLEGSKERVPVLNSKLQVVKNGGIMILAQGKYNDLVVYDIVTIMGEVRRVTEAVLLGFIDTEKRKLIAKGVKDPIVLINGKIIPTTSGKFTISALKGSYPVIDVKEIAALVNKSQPKAQPTAQPTAQPKAQAPKQLVGLPMVDLRRHQCKQDEILGLTKWNIGDSITSEESDVITRSDIVKVFMSDCGSEITDADTEDTDTELFARKYLGNYYTYLYEPIALHSEFRLVTCGTNRDFMGLAEEKTGKIVIPCWFEWANFGDGYYNGGIAVKDAPNGHVVAMVRTDDTNLRDAMGYIDLTTRKITRMAYGVEGDNFFKRKNIFTGKVEDIMQTLSESTETLDDLMKYVPDFWKNPVQPKKVLSGIPMVDLRANQVNPEDIYRYTVNEWYQGEREGVDLNTIPRRKVLEDFGVRNFNATKDSSFTRNHLGIRYVTVYQEGFIAWNSNDHTYYQPVSCYEPVGGMGLADSNTGKVVIPCWFNGDLNEAANTSYDVAPNKDLVVRVLTSADEHSVLAGFINLSTRKITRMAYELDYNSFFKCKNLYTGEVEDIMQTLEESTETLDDLMKYVPDFWK